MTSPSRERAKTAPPLTREEAESALKHVLVNLFDQDADGLIAKAFDRHAGRTADIFDVICMSARDREQLLLPEGHCYFVSILQQFLRHWCRNRNQRNRDATGPDWAVPTRACFGDFLAQEMHKCRDDLVRPLDKPFHCAATSIQSLTRGHMARHSTALRHHVATHMQRLVRGHAARCLIAARHRAAVHVQRMTRGHMVRHSTALRQNAAIHMQRAARGFIARSIVTSELVANASIAVDAAITLQCAIRDFITTPTASVDTAASIDVDNPWLQKFSEVSTPSCSVFLASFMPGSSPIMGRTLTSAEAAERNKAVSITPRLLFTDGTLTFSPGTTLTVAEVAERNKAICHSDPLRLVGDSPGMSPGVSQAPLLGALVSGAVLTRAEAAERNKVVTLFAPSPKLDGVQALSSGTVLTDAEAAERNKYRLVT